VSFQVEFNVQCSMLKSKKNKLILGLLNVLSNKDFFNTLLKLTTFEPYA